MTYLGHLDNYCSDLLTLMICASVWKTGKFSHTSILTPTKINLLKKLKQTALQSIKIAPICVTNNLVHIVRDNSSFQQGLFQ